MSDWRKTPRHAGEDPETDGDEGYRGGSVKAALFQAVLLPAGVSMYTATPDQLVVVHVHAVNQLGVHEHADVQAHVRRGMYVVEILGPGGVSSVTSTVRARAAEKADEDERPDGYRGASRAPWGHLG